MRSILCIALLALLPALAVAQRESYKSSSKFNSAAARVPDKVKEKATADKFNGQRTEVAPKPKPSTKPTVQGSVETGNRIKGATTERKSTTQKP